MRYVVSSESYAKSSATLSLAIGVCNLAIAAVEDELNVALLSLSLGVLWIYYACREYRRILGMKKAEFETESVMVSMDENGSIEYLQDSE